MNADGSGRTPLLTGATDDRDPAFSPDGKRIVFRRSGATDAETDIFVMNADGSGPVNLTQAVTESAFTPSFSPDGQRIAVTFGLFANHDVALINADGSGFVNLTNTVGQREEGPDWESVYTCAGRRATIVGSDAAENLVGATGPDVIVGTAATTGSRD